MLIFVNGWNEDGSTNLDEYDHKDHEDDDDEFEDDDKNNDGNDDADDESTLAPHSIRLSISLFMT